MQIYPVLSTEWLGSSGEDSMRIISLHRLKEIVGPIRRYTFGSLLGLVTVRAEIPICKAWRKFLSINGLYRRASHEDFTPSVVGGPVNRARCDLRFKDRGNGLWMPR